MIQPSCTALSHAVLSWLLLFLMAPMVTLAPAAAQVAAEQLPTGFIDRAITEVYGSPTDLAWLGDDLLVATQEGWLFRLSGSQPQPTHPAMILDVSDVVGIGQEQGLLGVIPDPDFPSRPYIYVYYTRSRGTGHCDILPANCNNRVSRLTLRDDGMLDRASEVTLVDTILAGSLHNGGDLAFGRNGDLFITSGDSGNWASAQDLTSLNGKILRIDRDGAPAPGNPFAAPAGQPCAMGRSRDVTAPCAEIYAYGLRNPFRIAFDPNHASDRFFINDVGQESWEEIELGERGANYGWPAFEGPCPPASSKGCGTDARYVAPIFAYPHSSGCFAITGGAFVPTWSSWGRAYHGTYLFADWGCGRIAVLTQEDDGRYAASEFASGLTTIAPLLFSRDGDTLFYAREGGIVRSITRAE